MKILTKNLTLNGGILHATGSCGEKGKGMFSSHTLQCPSDHLQISCALSCHHPMVICWYLLYRTCEFFWWSHGWLAHLRWSGPFHRCCWGRESDLNPLGLPLPVSFAPQRTERAGSQRTWKSLGLRFTFALKLGQQMKLKISSQYDSLPSEAQNERTHCHSGDTRIKWKMYRKGREESILI